MGNTACISYIESKTSVAYQLANLISNHRLSYVCGLRPQQVPMLRACPNMTLALCEITRFILNNSNSIALNINRDLVHINFKIQIYHNLNIYVGKNKDAKITVMC